MKITQKTFFSWRLTLILALGTAAGAALFLFSDFVASLPEESVGPVPLSWGFKQQAARVAGFFDMEHLVNNTPGEPPSIDATVPERLEIALFALG